MKLLDMFLMVFADIPLGFVKDGVQISTNQQAVSTGPTIHILAD